MAPSLAPGHVEGRPGLSHRLAIGPLGRPALGDAGPRCLGPHGPRGPALPGRPPTLVVHDPGRPVAPVVRSRCQ